MQAQYPSSILAQPLEHPLWTTPTVVEKLTMPAEAATNVKVKSIAKEAFLQLGVALTLNFTVMFFVVTPFSVAVLTGALVGAIAGVVGQMAIDLYYRTKDSAASNQKLQNLKDVSQVSMINTIGLAGPNIAIHETGHALSATACFIKSHPEVQIFPFLGGMTSYTFSNGLTKLGTALGQHRAFMFVTAAGFLSSTLFAMFEFGMADLLKDSYPTLSKVMNIHGVLQIAQEVLYALTAFIANRTDLAHDFVNLWVSGGIHPLIPISLMILLPLAEIWLLRLLACREKSQKINETTIRQQWITPPTSPSIF